MQCVFSWAMRYPIEQERPDDDDPFILQRSNNRNAIIAAFRKIRNRRLMKRPTEHLTCPACEYNKGMLLK